MYLTPALQRYVETLAARYKADLAKEGVVLCLYLERWDYLVIENHGNGTLTLANYMEMGGALCPNPAVVFYIRLQRRGRAAWMPVAVAELFGGGQRYARPDRYGGGVLVDDPRAQMHLAYRCDNHYLPCLIEAGWLEAGQRTMWPRVPKSVDECIRDLMAILGIHHAAANSDQEEDDGQPYR